MKSTVLSKLNGKIAKWLLQAQCVSVKMVNAAPDVYKRQDEITPTSHIIQQRLGLLKGTTAGEGAQFFLLSAQKEEQTFCLLYTSRCV